MLQTQKASESPWLHVIVGTALYAFFFFLTFFFSLGLALGYQEGEKTPFFDNLIYYGLILSFQIVAFLSAFFLFSRIKILKYLSYLPIALFIIIILISFFDTTDFSAESFKTFPKVKVCFLYC